VERPDRVLPLRDNRCRHVGRTGEGRRERAQLGRIPPEVWAALLDDAKARRGAREGVPAWARAVPLLAGGAVIERVRLGVRAASASGKLRYRIGCQGLLRSRRNPASPRHGGRSPQESHGRNGTLRYTCSSC
jgi:hypothetical protein